MASPNLAFFDVETSTVNEKVLISGFAAIILDAEGLFQVESFFTAIRTDSNPNAPPFSQVVDKIHDLLKGKVWVGFNLKQSVDQLTASFADGKRAVPKASSTLDLSSLPALTKSFPSGLANLAQHFGLGQPRQRAAEDVRMMLDIFQRCTTSIFLKIHVPDLDNKLIVATEPVALQLPALKSADVKTPAKAADDTAAEPSPAVTSAPAPAAAPALVPDPASTPVAAAPTAAVVAKPAPKKAWGSVPPSSPPVTATPAPAAAPKPLTLAEEKAPAPPAIAAVVAPAAPVEPSDAGASAAHKSKKTVVHPDAKPLKTGWADLVAPNREKTHLSFEPVDAKAKGKGNGNGNANKVKGNATGAKSPRPKKEASDGSSAIDAKTEGNKRQFKPRKQSADGAEAGSDKPKGERKGPPRTKTPQANDGNAPAKRQFRRKSKSDVHDSKEPQQEQDEGWNPVPAKVRKPKEDTKPQRSGKPAGTDTRREGRGPRDSSDDRPRPERAEPKKAE